MQFLEHFISNVQPSVEKPVLLFSIIELAKRSCIILMTFHAHTTHKMQPFDRGVFGPFFYNNAINNWMISPGYAILLTVLNVLGFFLLMKMFLPFDENVFTEIDFLAANVTYRPIVDTEISVFNDSIEVETAPGNLPSTSFIVSPEMI